MWWLECIKFLDQVIFLGLPTPSLSAFGGKTAYMQMSLWWKLVHDFPWPPFGSVTDFHFSAGSWLHVRESWLQSLLRQKIWSMGVWMEWRKKVRYWFTHQLEWPYCQLISILGPQFGLAEQGRYHFHLLLVYVLSQQLEVDHVDMHCKLAPLPNQLG